MVRFHTLATSPMYIHEIRGAVYVSYVDDLDSAFALTVPLAQADEFKALLESLTGKTLRVEEL